MATRRNLSNEIRRYRQAEALLALGLRVPLVCEMTRLSHWFLRKLALEIHGSAPAKGQVPNSELWYLKGRNNLHASLFLALYRPIQAAAEPQTEAADLLILAFHRYREIVEVTGLPEILTPDRAWWLLKSLRIPSLKRAICRECRGAYLMHQGDLGDGYRCVCCLANAVMRRAQSATVARLPVLQCEGSAPARSGIGGAERPAPSQRSTALRPA
jgi:flagellar transcriptional activator FlhC